MEMSSWPATPPRASQLSRRRTIHRSHFAISRAGPPARLAHCQAAGHDSLGLRASNPTRAASPKGNSRSHAILVGDADIPDVHAHAVAIEAGIAGSRRVVTDAGHLMYLEKPEEFSRVVITLIDRNGR